MINSRCQSNRQSGFSIIEVLISIVVIGLTLTALAASLTFSIELTNQARYRDIASKKAQEAVDYFKRERVILGWSLFYNELDSSGYCMSSVPSVSNPPGSISFDSLTTGDCGAAAYDLDVAGIGPDFKREVDVVKAGFGDPVTLTVTVSWPEDHSVQVEQEFYRW